jgi:hypothetical protein
MKTTVSFLSSVEEKLEFKAFGKIVHDFSITPKEKTTLGSNVHFVKVYGIKALGICHKLSNPLLTILPGTGEAPLGCSDFETPEFLMWTLPKDHVLVTFSSQIGTVDELINSEFRCGPGVCYS